MKTPLLLLGATIMFWGWLAGQLVLATIMTLVVEGSHFIKLRWDLSTSDFNRISNFCSIVLIGLVVYLFAANKSFNTIIIILKWLPVALFPLLFFHLYSTSDRIDISALFLVIRKKKGQKGKSSGININLTYPYFILCILSASASNVRNVSFYAGLLLISAWALWTIRSKRFSPILWVFLLILAGIGGYVGHIGLHGLQNILEEKGDELFAGSNLQDTDPFQSITAIGDIGTLKLSDRILFRVKPGYANQSPILLREASYNLYKLSLWLAIGSKFSKVQPDSDGTTWKFQPKPNLFKMITVSANLKRGKGILKLPNGTFQISDLPVSKLERNQSGAIKVEDGPRLITYKVRFSQDSSLDSPPDERDLSIPRREKQNLSRIIDELKLKSKSPREILSSVNSFFQNKFEYSLILDKKSSNSTPIANFLLRTRSGHCEYFATATALLLRAAGIPARYASGFSVQEFKRLEQRFVVRARHAHAWTLVYIDGAWQDFDTTPPSWINIEEDAASIWSPLFDFWSLCVFKFSEWRWRERKSGIAKHMLWLLIPILIFLGWRLYVKLYAKRVVKQVKIGLDKKTLARSRPGEDSEFYTIEKRLIEFGFVRYPHETFSSWIKRIEDAQSPPVSIDRIRSILAIHYRYRFDPKGISFAEKSALESSSELWLEKHKQKA